MLYAVMDIHKKNTHAVVKMKQGKVIKEDEINTKEKEIKQFFEDIEEELAEEVHLANPYKTRLIAEEKVNTDKIDANALADLIRGNLLPTSYVPCKEIRDL